MLRISLRMKNSKDHDSAGSHDIEDLVRKTSQQSPPNGLVDEGVRQRVARDGLKASLNREKEFRSQPIDLLFIPLKSFGEFMFGFWTKPEDSVHKALRSLFRTTSQGDPALGFLR